MSYLICGLCRKFFWSRIRIPKSCWIVPELRIYFKFCPLVHLFHTHPLWNFNCIVIIVHWVEQTLAFYVFLFRTLRGRLNLKRSRLITSANHWFITNHLNIMYFTWKKIIAISVRNNICICEKKAWKIQTCTA